MRQRRIHHSNSEIFRRTIQPPQTLHLAKTCVSTLEPKTIPRQKLYRVLVGRRRRKTQNRQRHRVADFGAKQHTQNHEHVPVDAAGAHAVASGKELQGLHGKNAGGVQGQTEQNENLRLAPGSGVCFPRNGGDFRPRTATEKCAGAGRKNARKFKRNKRGSGFVDRQYVPFTPPVFARVLIQPPVAFKR